MGPQSASVTTTGIFLGVRSNYAKEKVVVLQTTKLVRWLQPEEGLPRYKSMNLLFTIIPFDVAVVRNS